jgi:PAS domain S-box-containing protein
MDKATIPQGEERYRDIFHSVGVSLWLEDFSEVKTALDDLKARGVEDFRRYFVEHPEFVHRAIGLVKIIDVNNETLKMFGATEKSELMGSLQKIFVPETEVVFLDELLAFVQGEPHSASEIVVQTLQGERRHALCSILSLPTSTNFDNVLVSLTDINERKRAEVQLEEERDILETINSLGQMLSAELDLQKLVQALTDAATEITGAQFGSFFYNILDERGGSYMLYTLSGVPREHFAHFPMPRATELFGPTFRGEGVIRISNVREDPRYGKNAPYEGMPPGHLPVRSYLAVPVISRSGEVLGGLFFGHSDIGVFTERHENILMGLAGQAAIAVDNARLYEATQKARQEAETANRLKDEFLATVSHKLRTPLNAMLGWTRMLRSGKLDASSTARALESIERNSKAQQQIIEDILDVSRIITGKLRLDVSLVEIAPAIEAAVEALRPTAEAKGIRLKVILDTNPNLVHGDSNRLQQIIWNLLSNAIKFTPKGGRVQLILERVNSHIEVTVSDTGLGISKEFLPYVFERFQQADSSASRQYGGLGLGLAIVRHLVELHGGTVTGTSSGLNLGSIFIVKLPLAIMREGLNRSDQESPLHFHKGVLSGLPSDYAMDLSGLKVLVVDDEADARELMSMVLQQCGAEVQAASSTREALKVLEDWRPDVLISDIGMPGEDGYVLIKKVRALHADRGGRTPAAALTAYARSEDRLRALAAGYHTHVVKPVEPSELAAVVASLAGRTGKHS